jgi:hypothetical protein
VKLDLEQTVGCRGQRQKSPVKSRKFCAVHRPDWRDSQPHLVRK